MRGPALDLKSTILDRMDRQAPFCVWTPSDFVDAQVRRDAVDQALHRLTKDGTIRRLVRGLYDRPKPNSLTRQVSPPDPKAVIDALARRDGARMLVDGITAANDLGFTNAVPAKVVVHTDARLTPFALGGLNITFKKTAPSKLYWAGRPAMRVVQALHWLKDSLPADGPQIHKRLQRLLADPTHGPKIAADLRDGFTALPAWMQDVLRDLVLASAQDDQHHHRRRQHDVGAADDADDGAGAGGGGGDDDDDRPNRKHPAQGARL